MKREEPTTTVRVMPWRANPERRPVRRGAGGLRATSPPDEVARIVRRIYACVQRLERIFEPEKRRFTPDGHMVGSLGEALAARMFGLTLLGNSEKGHDARAGRKLVQIKTTQRKHVELRSEPEHLLVLKLDPTGQITVVYDGPGARPWTAAGGKMVRRISLAQLRQLAEKVAVNRMLRTRPSRRSAGAAAEEEASR